MQVGALAALSQTLGRSANDQVQVGFIGCGARGQELIRFLQKVPGTAIVGLVDAYKGRIDRSLDRTSRDVKVHRTYSDLLADKSIDAVVIATPDHWHKRMVIEAVNAGKDVYCEKPLTFRSSEGPEIIAAARKAQKIVQVGSQGVSGDLADKAREWVKSGKLGKVTMIRASYNRNTASGAWIYPIPPDASPSTVDFDQFLGPAPKRPYSNERFFRWRCYKDYSGGIATDLFVHLATAIHYIMDAKVPARAASLGQLYRWKESREVPDTLNSVLEYPEQFAVNLSSSFNNQTEAESGYQFMGTEGTMTISDRLRFYPERAREDNRWVVESWPKSLEEAYYKDPAVQKAEVDPLPGPAKQAEEFQPKVDSNVAHMSNWVESIRTRKPHWEDASAGHHAAAVAHMVNTANETARIVEWDAAKDDIRGKR